MVDSDDWYMRTHIDRQTDTHRHTHILPFIFKVRKWKDGVAKKFLELKFRTSAFNLNILDILVLG